MIRNKIISFFLRHPQYFIESIENRYPVNRKQLIKYRDFLDWHKISFNENICWDAEMVREFKDDINWTHFTLNAGAFKDVTLVDEFVDRIVWKSSNRIANDTLAMNAGIPWSIEFIEKYKSKLDFGQLSENECLPWSEELLKKYYDLWHFPNLTQNNALPWSLEFFEKYFVNEKLHNCYFGMNKSIYGVYEIVDKWNRFLDWKNICENPALPWIEKNLLQKWKHNIIWHSIACNPFLLGQKKFLEDHIGYFMNSVFLFHNLSLNEGLPWSKELLERYKNLWHWENISVNKVLPWSIALIEEYSDHLVWGGYEEYIDRENLTAEQIQNGTTLGTYHMGLVINQGLPWSIDFILYFENELDDIMLKLNTSAWEKAFKPFVDDELIEKTFKILL